MTGLGASRGGADGGPARHVSDPFTASADTAKAPHIPVLLDEVLEALGVAGGDFLDGTFGAGGYTRAILEADKANRVLALDRDPTAIAAGQAMVQAYGGRLALVETEFSNMEAAATGAGFGLFDGIVLDIGVSSMQLDQAIRGFSFRNDGPLDMRMAGDAGDESAADIVNSASETRIADILYHYGEERLSRVIARAIVADRQEMPFTTTRQLSEMIGRIIRTKPGDIHPATRSFQALRIAVNDELGELARALHAAERLLKPGGRLAVVSFHSLEDRIVKVFFAARAGKVGGSRHAPVIAQQVATFRVEGKWPVTAGEAELHVNPRARSAKLRAAIRTEAPAQAPETSVFELAALPESLPRKSTGKKPAGKSAPRRSRR
jgi:16S rRNA (cytosine1402-N4)-methyltransferase